MARKVASPHKTSARLKDVHLPSPVVANEDDACFLVHVNHGKVSDARKGDEDCLSPLLEQPSLPLRDECASFPRPGDVVGTAEAFFFPKDGSRPLVQAKNAPPSGVGNEEASGRVVRHSPRKADPFLCEGESSKAHSSEGEDSDLVFSHFGDEEDSVRVRYPPWAKRRETGRHRHRPRVHADDFPHRIPVTGDVDVVGTEKAHSPWAVGKGEAGQDGVAFRPRSDEKGGVSVRGNEEEPSPRKDDRHAWMGDAKGERAQKCERHRKVFFFLSGKHTFFFVLVVSSPV